ncbi:MAG TPA: hypothetical protein VNZ67_09770 [bacterium]|jgi:hypothetical protein|nr:hypothetical protein [bacterium]
MKKMLALATAASFLLLAGCVKQYQVESAGTPLSTYSTIKVTVDAARFLQTKEGDKHYDGYVKSCDDMRGVITGRINNWVASNFHGTTGGPVANLKITVDDFYTGSGAARFFLGDAANGHLNVSCTITGGHQFLSHAEIAGVGTDKLEAYWHVASACNSYIMDHE